MNNQITNLQKNIYLIPLAIIIVGIVIAGAIIITGGIKINTGVQLAEISPSADSGSQPEPTNPEETDDLDPQPKPTGSGGAVQLVANEEDHIRGNSEASVTIIEFSDFQCPFCARFHPTVKQILNDYPDQVRWVYKHFPLDSIHPEARPSAEASECAAEQGKFWEFADGLFENQSRLGSNLYKEIASDIGLDVSQFESCVSSRKYKDHVEADLQEGIKSGITGTPGSFINGEKISGAVPYDSLKASVERAL